MEKEYVITVSGLENAAKVAEWGTFGPFQRIADFKWVRLMDCSTEHLKAIQRQVGIRSDYYEIINFILNSRE